MKKLLFLLLITFPLLSCVDEHWPKVLPKYEDALVVDGMISNMPGPYEIKLSLTSPVNMPTYQPLSGCEVVILDNNDYSETLLETSPGCYFTSVNGIQGECGNSYKISIITPNGDKYETDFEEMAFPTEIENISHEIEYQAHPDYDRNTTGFRFFVSTQTAETKSNYYLWKLESTYKFNANYRIRYVWDGQLHNFENTDSLYTCYLTDKIPEFFLFKTEAFVTQKLIKYPLNYVNTETKALSIRYSLLVSQLSITSAAFIFWNNIMSQQDEQGTLYSRLPFQIRGNLKNINNEDEPVLGYFMVAGISSKRIFVNRPLGLNWYYSNSCNIFAFDKELLDIHISEWPLFLPGVSAGVGQFPAWVDNQWCLDCTKAGGYLGIPDFWED